MAHSNRRPDAVETEDYIAMLHRMLAALERRLADDPAGLVHMAGLRSRLRDAENAAIAASQEGADRYSFGELAAILGMARPSVYQRALAGRLLLDARRVAAGLPVLRRHRRNALDVAGVRDRRAGTPHQLQPHVQEKQ